MNSLRTECSAMEHIASTVPSLLQVLNGDTESLRRMHSLSINYILILFVPFTSVASVKHVNECMTEISYRHIEMRTERFLIQYVAVHNLYKF